MTTAPRSATLRRWLKRALALGTVLAASGCVALVVLWPEPHPGKSRPTHSVEAPAPEPARALRWADPERQREGHTCGLHAVSVLYKSYGLDPAEFRLRERLGIDVPALAMMDSTTGMLPTDLFRVLGEDGFRYEVLSPKAESAAATLGAHLDQSMALCVVPLGGFEMHWVAARQDAEGRAVLLDSLGGEVTPVDLTAFLRDTALSVVLVRPTEPDDKTQRHPHRDGAKEMGKVLRRK